MNITMRELRAKLAHYLDLAAAGTPVHVERKGKTVVLLPAYEGGLPPGPLSETFRKLEPFIPYKITVKAPTADELQLAKSLEDKIMTILGKPKSWKERNAAQAARDALLGGGKK